MKLKPHDQAGVNFASHDQLMKQLGQIFFRPYLELFFPQLAARLILDDPAFPVTFDDKEVFTDFPLGQRKQLDHVARVWTREHAVEQVLLLNEFQEDNDLIDVTPVNPQALEWLIKDNKPLPLAVRLMLYCASLQLRHFPVPVIPVATWFCGGKGGLGKDRYDYRPLEAGLGVTYYRVCVPDLPAEEYVQMDNPVGFGLAVRMKRQRMSKVELTMASRQRIVRSSLNQVEKDLLWTFNQTYARLTEDEEQQMQVMADKRENQDVKEANLTWAGKLMLQGRQEGRKEGRKEGRQEGRQEELFQRLLEICPVIGVRLTPARRQQLSQLDLSGLESLWRHLLSHKKWPAAK